MPIRLSCIVDRARNAEADMIEYGYVRGGESSKIERMSPWVKRKSREPSDNAMTMSSEIVSGRPTQSRSVHLDRVGIFTPPPITHLCDLTDIRRESSTVKDSPRISPEDPHHRSQNPVMSTSHTDLSPTVKYAGEYINREFPLAASAKGNRPTAIFSDESMLSLMSRDNNSIDRSFVDVMSNRPEVARWLERMGPDVECPTISVLAGSSTICNTVTSYDRKSATDGICSIDMISDASPTAPRSLLRHFEYPPFDDHGVTPVAPRTELSPASRQIATRTHDDSYDNCIVRSLDDVLCSNDSVTLDDYCGEQWYGVPALSKESVMSFDEDSNRDYCLLAGALTELTEFSDALTNLVNGDRPDHAEPTTAVHGSITSSGVTPNVHERHVSESLRHHAKSPQTGGYKSAIPRLRSFHYGHIRGAFKKNALESKRLYPNIDGLVSSKARTMVTPRGRQQTFEEDIGRRCGCKQNVSTKGLGLEIDLPDSGLEETLLDYQACVRTDRGGGKSSAGMVYPNSDRDGRSTSSKLDHVERLAPRSGSGRDSNRRDHTKQEKDRQRTHSESQQHESKIPVRMNRRVRSDIERQLVETTTGTAVERQVLGRKVDTRHANKHCDIAVKRKDADIVARKTRSPTAELQVTISLLCHINLALLQLNSGPQ